MENALKPGHYRSAVRSWLAAAAVLIGVQITCVLWPQPSQPELDTQDAPCTLGLAPTDFRDLTSDWLATDLSNAAQQLGLDTRALPSPWALYATLNANTNIPPDDVASRMVQERFPSSATWKQSHLRDVLVLHLAALNSSAPPVHAPSSDVSLGGKAPQDRDDARDRDESAPDRP